MSITAHLLRQITEVSTALRIKGFLLIWFYWWFVHNHFLVGCLMLPCKTSCIFSNQEVTVLFIFIFENTCVRSVLQYSGSMSVVTLWQRGASIPWWAVGFADEVLRENNWSLLLLGVFSFLESMFCHSLHILLSGFRC